MPGIPWLSFEDKGGGGEHRCSKRYKYWLKHQTATWEEQLPSFPMLIITIIQW